MIREPRQSREIPSGAGTRRIPWLPVVFVLVAASVGAPSSRADEVALDVADTRGISMPAARADDVALTVEDSRGIYIVQGAFTAPVSPEVAWDVLTDYDHIGDFVKSVRASRVEQRGDGWLLLRQDARGGTFPLLKTMHVWLRVHEQPGRQIKFVDRLGQDFRVYNGEWNLAPTPAGSAVQYTLEARPMAAMPRQLARAWIRHAARDLLQEVRVEMIRRSGGTPNLSPPRLCGRVAPHAAGGMDLNSEGDRP